MTDARPQEHRSPGPDIARGLALAIVAISNTVWWLHGYETGEPRRFAFAEADTRANSFNALFITGRAYPMFSFLFGYGIVQALGNQAARGLSNGESNRLVVRRNWILIAMGALHALLLFNGDVLGAYGVLGFIVLLLARRSERTILVVALLFLAFRIVYDHLSWSAQVASNYIFYDVANATSYAETVPLRGQDWLELFASLPYYLAPMLFGVYAAGRRILEEPGRHRKLLIWFVVGGFAVSILGGLPEALARADLWYPESDATWRYLDTIRSASGIPGGFALAALCGLLALAATTRKGLATLAEPLRCLGRRSLSGYLFQSFAFLLIFPAYTLDLGSEVDDVGAMTIALSVWAVSIGLAVILDRSDRLGPGEWLMRRFVYGRRA